MMRNRALSNYTLSHHRSHLTDKGIGCRSCSRRSAHLGDIESKVNGSCTSSRVSPFCTGYYHRYLFASLYWKVVVSHTTVRAGFVIVLMILY